VLEHSTTLAIVVKEAYHYIAKIGAYKYDVNNIGAKVADSVNISLVIISYYHIFPQ